VNKKILLAGIGVLVIVVLMNLPKNKGVSKGASKPSSPAVEAKRLYEKATALKKDRKLVEAKAIYQNIISEYPNIDRVEQIQKELENLNLEVIFSNIPVKQAIVHKVSVGDTLGKIAQKYGTTVELIKKSNRLKSDIIQIDQRLRVWTEKFNIFVDKSQNILILKAGDDVVKVYAVSTGENNSTPVGKFKVVSRLKDPVWFNRGAVVPPESPENVLGSRWLGFDLPGYGIHGTIEPETIGQQITAGCVRMRNAEVEELYSMIPKGTEVTVVD